MSRRKADNLLRYMDVPVEEDQVAFRVHGVARPAGSKTAYPAINARTGLPMKRDGRIVMRVVEAGKHTPRWKQTLAAMARMAVGSGWRPLTGPLKLYLNFQRCRPKSHYGTGRNADLLKPSAPEYPTGPPDLLKLARAAEDAFKGILYDDDARIVDEVLQKRWSDKDVVMVTLSRVQTASAGQSPAGEDAKEAFDHETHHG